MAASGDSFERSTSRSTQRASVAAAWVSQTYLTTWTTSCRAAWAEPIITSTFRRCAIDITHRKQFERMAASETKSVDVGIEDRRYILPLASRRRDREDRDLYNVAGFQKVHLQVLIKLGPSSGLNGPHRVRLRAADGGRGSVSERRAELHSISHRYSYENAASFATAEDVVSGSAQWHSGCEGDCAQAPHQTPHPRY